MKKTRILAVLTALTLAITTASAGASAKADRGPQMPTAEDIANAVPRDLVIDHRGLGYLRGVDGSLTPYGHEIPATKAPIVPMAPGGVPGPPGGNGGGEDDGGGDVREAEWTSGGQVHESAGRVLFQLTDGWYVCSGTVVTDGASGRSIVLTAAHCVFDDVNKNFALNAYFIPSQDDGGSDRTDFDCNNDKYGCWVLDHGVVDVNWTTRVFPDNIEWDYGYYVVADTGAHQGTGSNESLEDAAGTLPIDFGAPTLGDFTHALGYSYDHDPEFMYCAGDIGTTGDVNYWLGKCKLTGGSSGGPWIQDMVDGAGPIISVNSWGYLGRPGMAGPKLAGSSASAVFSYAKTTDSGFNEDFRGYTYTP